MLNPTGDRLSHRYAIMLGYSHSSGPTKNEWRSNENETKRKKNISAITTAIKILKHTYTHRHTNVHTWAFALYHSTSYGRKIKEAEVRRAKRRKKIIIEVLQKREFKNGSNNMLQTITIRSNNHSSNDSKKQILHGKHWSHTNRHYGNGKEAIRRQQQHQHRKSVSHRIEFHLVKHLHKVSYSHC